MSHQSAHCLLLWYSWTACLATYGVCTRQFGIITQPEETLEWWGQLVLHSQSTIFWTFCMGRLYCKRQSPCTRRGSDHTIEAVYRHGGGWGMLEVIPNLEGSSLAGRIPQPYILILSSFLFIIKCKPFIFQCVLIIVV